MTVLQAPTSERISYRQAIAVLNSAGVEASATAWFLNCSVDTVYFWLHRRAETNDLSDRTRAGRPPRYLDTDHLRIIAFYCQTTPLQGCGRWTFRWAQKHLAASPELIGVAPGKSTLHRILNENGLKPHQSAYFLHITDPDFFPKMEHLLDLYSHPPPFLFFFDECPGIQILKRLAPHLQTEEVKKRLAEFEYIRNGTMDVFAFLEHSTGKVYTECHGDHTTSTFLAVFRRQVKRLPVDQTLHYVMDNLSTHCSYSFCLLVAELSGVECPPEAELDKPDKRQAWLNKGDKRIVIHFTPCHGSWLNLVEIWFRILNYALLEESFDSPEAFKAAFDAFDQAWNTLLAHPFRWSYDGKGLQEKAVKRFAILLETSAETLDIRFLTKSLQLMTNLLEQYLSEVAQETWNRLLQAATSKLEILEGLIGKEEGPQRKKKAEQALTAFTNALNRLLAQDQRKAA